MDAILVSHNDLDKLQDGIDKVLDRLSVMNAFIASETKKSIERMKWHKYDHAWFLFCSDFYSYLRFIGRVEKHSTYLRLDHFAEMWFKLGNMIKHNPFIAS